MSLRLRCTHLDEVLHFGGHGRLCRLLRLDEFHELDLQVALLLADSESLGIPVTDDHDAPNDANRDPQRCESCKDNLGRRTTSPAQRSARAERKNIIETPGSVLRNVPGVRSHYYAPTPWPQFWGLRGSLRGS